MKTIGQLIKEELINLAINDKLPQDLNELDATLFDKIAMGESKQFPNGFESWSETHHEIVRYVTIKLESFYDEEDSTIIKKYKSFGIGGEYILAKEWADEYEQLNEGNDYGEDDFFEKVPEFCDLKNYGDVSKL